MSSVQSCSDGWVDFQPGYGTLVCRSFSFLHDLDDQSHIPPLLDVRCQINHATTLDKTRESCFLWKTNFAENSRPQRDPDQPPKHIPRGLAEQDS